jgi:hypothetical protein
LGIAYSVEEMQSEPIRVESERVDTAPRRRAADVLDNPPTTEPVVPLITPQQLKKLHAMFGEKALTNRDEALAWMSNVLDRDITTSKELTRDEASRLFAELEREPDSTPEAGTE